MSLLLDALKRAEQEKQGRGASAGPAPAPGSRPSLELAPMAPEPAPGRQPPPAAAPLAPKLPSGTGRRTGLWIAAGAILLVICAAAGYVWYSIASLAPAQPIARAPVRPPPLPAVSAPVAPEPVAVKPQASSAPSPAPSPTPAQREPRAARAARTETTPAAPAAMLQPSRVAERPRVSPQVGAGYAALRAGDLDAARREYTAALAADASSLDAILGLATVEARSGKAEAAASLYRKALDVDPRNATAIAGLAAFSDLSRGESGEQQLMRDLAQNPGSAALHFMLGNLYASRSQWTQAQAAYFEAHRLDSANPDILHNLGVSLDRLGQARVAAGFYRRALEAARSQATQFDAAAVEKRLAEIEGAR